MCPCFYKVSEVTYEVSRGPLKALCQLKKPIKGRDEGIAGRTRREKYFPDEGDFFQKKKQEELVDRPGVSRARVLQVVVGQIG